MDDDQNAREFYEERAAIMQYDAGMKRYDAELYATVATWRLCQVFGYTEPRDTVYSILTRGFTGDEPRWPGDAGTFAAATRW